MEKSLDRKLARIPADPSCRDFIIADAKDADMALRPVGARPQPGASRRRGPLPHAGRVSPTDAGDRRPRAGQHHADERQFQRGADDPRAAFRR